MNTEEHAGTATVGSLFDEIETLWPMRTAEAWDRVGVVSGRRTDSVARVLLVVDVTRATVDEAIRLRADAIIAHHPLLLRGVHTVAEETAKGVLLAELIRARIALITAHTNADVPVGGVSDVIAERLGLVQAQPIVPGEDPSSGLGRVGRLAESMPLRSFVEHAAALFPPTVSGLRVAGDPERDVRTVALCGGAGDSLLDHPAVRAADVYLTSDLRHHPASESLELALAQHGPALVDVSHWASESLWLDAAADVLRERMPDLEFVVSRVRTDVWDFSVGARTGSD